MGNKTMENEGIVLLEVPRGAVVPCPTQPRKRFKADEISEMAESMRAVGVIQPLIVRVRILDAAEVYEIVAGEKRWRASGEAGLAKLPVLVRDIDDVKVAEMQLVENIDRGDLTPLEEAGGVERLQELGRDREQIAHALGRSDRWVQVRLDLGKLPEVARDAMRADKLGLGAASQILQLNDEDREAAAQSLMELGEAITNEDAKELLRIRYMEPRARRREWRKCWVDLLKGELEGYCEALKDCEAAPDYLRSWGAPIGKWIKSTDPLAHAAECVEEEGITWGELSRQLGIKILVVPKGDVFKGQVEFLVDGKAVREAEAAAREGGKAHTLGARKPVVSNADPVDPGDDDAGAVVAPAEPSRIIGNVEVKKNKEAVSLLGDCLDVWEPGWAAKYDCPVGYMLENLSKDDLAEDCLAGVLIVFFGLEIVKVN